MAARLLVIEDNAANLELMTYLLNAFGYATETARDGEDGLAKARQGGFDLVICDIQLPKMDGFEVALGIRQAAEERVPLVAVTAFAQVGDRERLMAHADEVRQCPCSIVWPSWRRFFLRCSWARQPPYPPGPALTATRRR